MGEAGGSDGDPSEPEGLNTDAVDGDPTVAETDCRDRGLSGEAVVEDKGQDGDPSVEVEAEVVAGDGDPTVPESEDKGSRTDGVLPNSTLNLSSSRLLYRFSGWGVEGAGWGSVRVVAQLGSRFGREALSSPGRSKEAGRPKRPLA